MKPAPPVINTFICDPPPTAPPALDKVWPVRRPKSRESPQPERSVVHYERGGLVNDGSSSVRSLHRQWPWSLQRELKRHALGGLTAIWRPECPLCSRACPSTSPRTPCLELGAGLA